MTDTPIVDTESTQPAALKSEKPSVNKSLAGKDLPENWPQIATDQEISGKFEGFDPQKDVLAVKLALELQLGDKQLAYLPVEHTNNVIHPQFAAIETRFKKIQPQVVLHEGPSNSAEFDSREQAMQFGEVGFLHYLVQEHNRNRSGNEQIVSIESADIPDAELIMQFQARGHSKEEIAVYDILRKINVTAEQIRRDASIDDVDRKVRLENLTKTLQADFQKYLTDHGMPNLFALLPRADGKEWNQENITEEVKNQTGQEISANLTQLDFDKFRKMFEEERVFRDTHIVKTIADKLQTSDKVLAVFGSSHVLREEKALRQLFGQ